MPIVVVFVIVVVIVVGGGGGVRSRLCFKIGGLFVGFVVH
jgi:hypothetical protein